MAGFVLVQDVVLDSAAASITFNTGLTDYTQFRLTLYVIKDGTASAVGIRLNGDTGSNYARQRITADSTTAAGNRTTGQTSAFLLEGFGVAPNGTALMTAEIAKPLTTTPARFTGQASAFGDLATDAVVYMANTQEWNNTADLISSISILSSSGDFAAGTRAVLEGWTDNDSATLSPVTFTLTPVAPAFILGTPALFKTGSYIPIITKKKVG